jgi:hypothetical protein
MTIIPSFQSLQTEKLGELLDGIMSRIIIESPNLSVVGPPAVPSYIDWSSMSHQACTSGKSKRLFEFLCILMNVLINETSQKGSLKLYHLKWENLFASGLRNYHDQIWLEIGMYLYFMVFIYKNKET